MLTDGSDWVRLEWNVDSYSHGEMCKQLLQTKELPRNRNGKNVQKQKKETEEQAKWISNSVKESWNWTEIESKILLNLACVYKTRYLGSFSLLGRMWNQEEFE